MDPPTVQELYGGDYMAMVAQVPSRLDGVVGQVADQSHCGRPSPAPRHCPWGPRRPRSRAADL
eukprot:6623053-Pyramimonas_sp.AAC.1